MKIIFAQGNPELRYESTRHNVGFYLLDQFVSEQGGGWTDKPKFFAKVSELTIGGEKVLCVKPSTYYNESGQSARAIIDFYKLDPSTDFLVVHDELALPFGTIRVRTVGSDAGNNGIKSLNAHIGENYTRIRVGISNDHRTSDDAAFVLERFNSEEATHLQTIFKSVNDLINQFIIDTLEHNSMSL
jgi:PTH1 family peptidyl-tRNA hydrolase